MTLLPVILPIGSTTKVSVGDKLTAGQVIAEKKGTKKEDIIHLSKDYKIPPNKIQKSLKKNLGDGVEKGTVIAVRKKIIGSQQIKSHIKGTIVKIDEESGDIYIKTLSQEDTEPIFSPVDGIVDFCNNEKIVIKTEKEVIVAQDSLGEEAEGEIFYIEHFDPAKLTTDISDKVVVTRVLDKVSLFKIIGLGANGIITEEIDDIDFIDLIEKKIKTPIMNVTEEDLKKLVKYRGRKIYMDTNNKSIVIL